MKHIISLLISISLLFPYTALSYSYNVENWEVEAETSQNLENPQAQKVAVPYILTSLAYISGTIIAGGLLMGGVFGFVVLVDHLANAEDRINRKKAIKTALELVCHKTVEVDTCKEQVNQLNGTDLNKIWEIAELLQKIPPSMREEILLKAQFATIPLGI